MLREREEDKGARRSERSPLAGCGVLSLGWVRRDDQRRPRERSHMPDRKEQQNAKYCFSLTHTYITSRIRQMENMKRAAFIYRQISEKVILHQAKQMNEYTHTHSHGPRQLTDMTFQVLKLFIQKKIPQPCQCVSI